GGDCRGRGVGHGGRRRDATERYAALRADVQRLPWTGDRRGAEGGGQSRLGCAHRRGQGHALRARAQGLPGESRRDAPEGRPHGCARRPRQAGRRSHGADGAIALNRASADRLRPAFRAIHPRVPASSAKPERAVNDKPRAREIEADAVKSITPRASIYMTHGSVAGPDSPYGELQPWVAHRDGRSDERIFRPRSPAMADRDSLSGRATATAAGRTEAAAHSRPER